MLWAQNFERFTAVGVVWFGGWIANESFVRFGGKVECQIKFKSAGGWTRRVSALFGPASRKDWDAILNEGAVITTTTTRVARN